MSLFQTSVLKKYLADLDRRAIERAFGIFRQKFHDTVRQENIRNAKEEQYQEGFLRDLFTEVLGYTLNPAPNFNLTTELKNIGDAKKADGAILAPDGSALAVIELKGTSATDFKKIEEQAFGYKNKQRGCRYVLTSNFERLRFYIDDATDFEEFDLFRLDQERFSLLWLCLEKNNLLAGLPSDIKNRSVVEEENITRKLYTDYSKFKKELFADLCQRNPQFDKLLLFQKSQKLLDRLLFIFFAEDRGLLPPNAIHEILTQWQELRDKYDEQFSLYSRFKKFFGYLDTGYQGKKYEIFGYNGGLFAPDEVLDALDIGDTPLFNGTWAITRYDFASEVDVDVLGHIFEHSLNEIEEIQAEIEGRPLDRAKTKRKKDGVFYTPKYITRYIVENTVGALCRQKQAEIGLREEDYADRIEAKKRRRELHERLNQYQNWLEGITVLDPACGSGAFLNAALNFLIEEHARLDRLRATLFGDALVLREVGHAILENNLFGVDINDESVEIAQLALWLRTAQKGRKLTALSRNLRVGNSLISDPAVAGAKAFDWQTAFPEVFAKGGFDVVIGNPPYVPANAISQQEKDFYIKNYESSNYQINTYGLFVEKCFTLLKNEALYSLIIPNYWLSTKYDDRLREIVFIRNHCLEILNTFQVFEGATVDTLILTIQKTMCASFPKTTSIKSIDPNLKIIGERLNAIARTDFKVNKTQVFDSVDVLPEVSFSEQGFDLVGEQILGDYFIFNFGMKPYQVGKGKPKQTREIVEGKFFTSFSKIDDTYFPLLTATSVKRYRLNWEGIFIKYGIHLAEPRKKEIFENSRILLNRILSGKKIDAVWVSETFINNTDVFNLIPKTTTDIETGKTLFAIIASRLCADYFKKKNVNLQRDAFPKLNTGTLESFPIPKIPNDTRKTLVVLVDKMLDFKKQEQLLTSRLPKLLQNKYPDLQVTKKISEWHVGTYADFLKEIKRQKVAWGLREEAEWMEYFGQEQLAVRALQDDIQKTDAEIDRLVYELYGLTEAEIAEVEGVFQA